MGNTILYSVALLLLVPVCTQAERDTIYQSIDADGRVTYSDIPSGQAKAVTLGQSSTYRAAKKITHLNPTTDTDLKLHDYQILEITSPLNDQSIRSNSGSLDIQVKLVPALNAGHKIMLLMDGEVSTTALVNQSGMWTGTLTNLDRGRHQFQVKIISTSSKNTIMVSPPVTVAIQRYSALHQQGRLPNDKRR